MLNHIAKLQRNKYHQVNQNLLHYSISSLGLLSQRQVLARTVKSFKQVRTGRHHLNSCPKKFDSSNFGIYRSSSYYCPALEWTHAPYTLNRGNISPFIASRSIQFYHTCMQESFTMQQKKQELQQDNKVQMMQQSELNFRLNGEQIQNETDRIIENSRKLQDHIANLNTENRNYNTVGLPISLDESRFSIDASNVIFPSFVSADKSTRDASASAQEQIDAFGIESQMREDVYQVVKQVYEQEFQHKDQEKNEAFQDALNQNEDLRLMYKLVREYERNGLNLPKETKERVKSLKNELSRISIQFSKNLAEDKTKFSFTLDELDGLPKDFLDNLPEEENTKKKIVSLKPPEILPVLQYCKNENTRQKLDIARSSQCLEDNLPLLKRAIEIRQEISQLMNYQTHSHYVLEDNMVDGPDEVLKFLNELKSKLLEYGRKDLEKLKELKGSDEFYSWDFYYYIRKLKEDNYHIDENLIKQYFPLNYVISGIFEIIQEVFQLKFEKIENAETWHSDVITYAVYDASTEEFIGKFYLDMFPRDGKYTHFAAFPLKPHFIDENGEENHPVAAMVCNFPNPNPEIGGYSLLKHDEVITFAHEMGHLLHGVLSKTKHGRFSGTQVERDFVEMPSQFLENFCWEKDVLKRISSHYETSEPLPDELIEKMIRAKNVANPLTYLRQIFFSLFDMNCHTLQSQDEAKNLDLMQLWAQLRKEIQLIENPSGTCGASSFAHLVSGYDSNYFGYLWSEIYAHDMFAKFKENGIFNAENGIRFRKCVLERGGSVDGKVMLREFLGRKPSQEAFLQAIGLSN